MPCAFLTHLLKHHPATCAQEAFPDCRGDRGCFKNHFASVKYCTAFFADCQDAQNRSQKPDSTTGMCYTTCSGETGQVWSWKQHTGSRKGEQPWRRQQHACHTHCSNLPPSFASPAWKLSRPGAIWSSLWRLYPSAQQLSSSDNHMVVRRTTCSMSKTEKKTNYGCL